MEKFMKPGVGGIIEQTIDGMKHILMQERCKEDAPSEEGLLEIPAGKIREFENIFDCLRREIREETGLEVTEIVGEENSVIYELNGYRVLSYEPFANAQNTQGSYPIMVQIFICKAKGELAVETNETKRLRWVPVKELQELIDKQHHRFYPMHVNTLRKYIKLNDSSMTGGNKVTENIFLAEPHAAYKEEFATFVEAYKDSGETPYYEMYKEALEDFDKYVLKLHNHAKGIDVPADWAPGHTFWLTNQEGQVLGATRIRTCNDNDFVKNYAGNIGYDISPLHRQKGYGKEILKLGLEKARQLGLEKTLITCNRENTGSIKVIESNGGVFESEVFCESKNEHLKRYWIKLA